MINDVFFGKLSGFFIFYRWHPAIALRYLPFVERIKNQNFDTILEVGSGGLGIAPYLKRKVTGLDMDFKPPFHKFLKRVKGKACKLPFRNSSFEAVVSLDMLEHLKKEDRGKAISEMLRVAKKEVMIGVPCGKAAEEEDIYLHKLYETKFRKQYGFLKEQTEEKLPEKEGIIKSIESAAIDLTKTIVVKSIGNENIHIHRILMKGWMTRNILVDIFFRKILLFFIPFIRLFDKPPYYRRLFFIEIKK